MPHKKDREKTPKELEELPIYGPQLEIVPTEEDIKREKEAERRNQRRIISEILDSDTTLPWVQPSWRERGKA